MSLKQEITDITEDLVRIQSTRDRPEEIQKAVEYVEDFFSSEKFNVERYRWNGSPSLVVTFDGTKDPEVMLHGHLDVVEADEEMFAPRLEDGKLYGRGTADMKAGVASLMKVMEDLEGEPDIALVLVTDEEMGGFDGMGRLVDEYDPGFAVSAEPNNMEGYMDIVARQKGVVWLKLEAEGEPAHASRPWKGDNAIEKLMERYGEIRERFDNSGDWKTTVNVGTFEGGGTNNRVPDHAEMVLDVRYCREYSAEEVIEDVKQLEDVSVEVLANDPMLKNDPENRYIQGLRAKAEEVVGAAEVTKKEPASDMRFLSSQGTPAVVFGPEGYGSHGDDEHAVVSSFEDYYSIMKQFVEETA